jgi:hypothetical protein
MNPYIRLVCICTIPFMSFSCTATHAQEPAAAIAVDPISDAASSAPLPHILNSMHKSTQQLTSAQCRISYLTIQDPGLLDSRVLRTGTL